MYVLFLNRPYRVLFNTKYTFFEQNGSLKPCSLHKLRICTKPAIKRCQEA